MLYLNFTFHLSESTVVLWFGSSAEFKNKKPKHSRNEPSFQFVGDGALKLCKLLKAGMSWSIFMFGWEMLNIFELLMCVHGQQIYGGSRLATWRQTDLFLLIQLRWGICLFYKPTKHFLEILSYIIIPEVRYLYCSTSTTLIGESPDKCIKILTLSTSPHWSNILAI